MRFRALLLAGIGACAIGIAAHAADDPIKERQELMKGIGDSMKALGQMAKGEQPYDAAVAEQALTRIHENIGPFPELFPEGTETGGDTAAAPAIWEKKDEFDELANRLETASTEAIPAATSGLDGLRGALGNVGSACRDCHEEFRLKKE